MKNKNTVKRIISMILMLTMLGTVVTVFSGCGLFSKKVIGTEAAKILLARERLDADAVGQKANIVSFNEDDADNSFFGNLFGNLFGSNKISASLLGGITPVTAAVASGAKKLDNSSVEWNVEDFGAISDSEVSYVQFIEPIDEMAARTADIIATIKDDVGVTDKWVNMFSSSYMLIVDENSETIIEKINTLDQINISIRYTTDDAKCIYEMYTFATYEDGTWGKGRDKCIPGEYYEYTFMHSNGYCDYFIAENSRGYWMTNRFSFNADHATFDLSVIGDDIGYGTLADVDNNFNITNANEYASANLFVPDDDRDIMKITGIPGNYTIDVYMTEIESGVEKLVGSNGSYSEEDYGSVGTVYLRGGGRGNDDDRISVALSNGGKISAGDSSDSVTYVDTNIRYNNFFGKKTYYASLEFASSAETVSDAYDDLAKFLDRNGIKLRTEKSKVIENYFNCMFLMSNFDVMEWNGYRMNSLDNMFAAEDLLKENFEKYRQVYEDVKDNESVTWAHDVSSRVTFGEMELISNGNATYADGSIIVDGLTARSESTQLLEEGLEYTLKIGLALRDSEGNISSVNTVSLASPNEITTTYTGDALEITQTAEYIVPTALTEGEYIVVVYFATAEEGIRVTEMFPVAFFSAEEGKLDSEFMNVTVKKSGENLFIDYEISLSYTVEAPKAKLSYSYDEIRTVLLRGVLAKGYPFSDATVQTESGTELSETETYGPGTYRLKFRVNTSEGLVEAYMYCTFEGVYAN